MGCEKLNNYNAMMEIISGLQCSAIFRLKHTWAACNKSYIKKYEEIHALMSRERNFQKVSHAHNTHTHAQHTHNTHTTLTRGVVVVVWCSSVTTCTAWTRRAFPTWACT